MQAINDIILGVLLGITQGIAEFLPISSSGHLIIVSHLMSGETLAITLNVALHVGTLVAVLYFFREDWVALTSKTWARITKGEKTFESQILVPSLVLGTIPAGAIGLLFKDNIESIFHNPLMVALPLALVGVLIWLVDIKAPDKKKLKELNLTDAMKIGFFQAIALIPGVSRSGITLLAARTAGYNKLDAARYSFLLGTPAMLGAALLEGKHILTSMGNPSFYVGVIVSAVVGCFAIKFFLQFIVRFGLLAFAIYRILIAGLIVYLVGF